LADVSAIVHESVHAWIDLQGYIGSASDADNEAAAYVTQSLFCFYATGRGHLDLDLQDENQPTWDRKAIFGIADRIARSIKDTAIAKIPDSDRQA
jgi:hypothetical protein